MGYGKEIVSIDNTVAIVGRSRAVSHGNRVTIFRHLFESSARILASLFISKEPFASPKGQDRLYANKGDAETVTKPNSCRMIQAILLLDRVITRGCEKDTKERLAYCA